PAACAFPAAAVPGAVRERAARAAVEVVGGVRPEAGIGDQVGTYAQRWGNDYDRGIDVLRARALGAQAVCVGRPVRWGLGCAGEAGVERELSILRQELDVALALAGFASPDEVGADLLRP
ncbi:MAG: alpha-hydroxy-acid oxidizing protein, partial [Phycisphaerales bacterium]